MRFWNRIWEPDFPFKPSRSPLFYGWFVAVLTAIGILASIPGQTVGVSIFTDVFVERLGISRLHLTTAYLVGTGLSGFIISYAGRLFDQMGARKFMVMSCTLFGVSLLFMSQIDRVSQALGGIVIISTIVCSFGFLGIRLLGQGMVTLGSRSMLAKWWNERRGTVSSYAGLFISFGFAIAPRVLDWQMQALGWRGAFIFNGILIGLGISLFAWLFFRDNPEECGLEMDGGWKPKKKHANPDTLLTKEFTRKEALQTYSFWIITLSIAFHSLFSTAYTFHITDLARTFQVDREEMLNFFIYSSFLAVAVNLSVGYIVDRIRLRYVIGLFGWCGGIFAISLLFLPGTVGVWGAVIGMGISWGAFPVLMNVSFSRYFGRKHLGAISGSCLAWLVWGSAAGPLLFSMAENYLGGYRTAIYVGIVAYAMLGLGGFFASNPSSTSGGFGVFRRARLKPHKVKPDQTPVM